MSVRPFTGTIESSGVDSSNSSPSLMGSAGMILWCTKAANNRCVRSPISLLSPVAFEEEEELVVDVEVEDEELLRLQRRAA